MATQDHTSNPADPILAQITQEALDDGRPVLIIPPRIAQKEEASVQKIHDDQGRKMVCIPEVTTVVFAGVEGFPCTSSPLSCTDSLTDAFSNGNVSEARGARPAGDGLQLEQSLYQSSCLSTEQVQDMKDPKRKSR